MSLSRPRAHIGSLSLYRCGAFQEKANGTAAGYSTAAAMFKVPKLARRGTSSDTQIISTFVGIDGIRCPGMEIGVISTVRLTL